jgi:tRNA pseudouridine38-40 synthase
VGPGLDWDAAAGSLAEIEGERDFAAFRSMGSPVSSTVREIYSASVSRPEPGVVRLELTGSGFLRHMARSIAGTVFRVARGELDREGVKGLVASRRRAAAGRSAPACGLCLRRVYYGPAGEGPAGEGPS